MTTTKNDKTYHRLMCALLNSVPDAKPEVVNQIVAVMQRLNERRISANG